MNQVAPSMPLSQSLVASLRSEGAANFDAVGWHYIEVLHERTCGQTGLAQQLLTEKLVKLLVDFKARFEAGQKPPQALPLPPMEPPSPLANLLNDMVQHLPTEDSTRMGKTFNWRVESPQVKKFRQALGKISVQKQVAKAMAQAPHNAGPINSHMLVLRSLGLMRQCAPDYLNRFMAYTQTLFYLDDAGKVRQPAPKKSTPLKR